MHTNEKPSVARRQQKDERLAFVFLGGNLALDLVNTEIIARGEKREMLMNCHDTAQWWEMARQVYPHLIQNQKRDEWSEQEVATLRSLRRTLRQMFESLAAQHQLDEEQANALNKVLREGYYALEISSEGMVSAAYKARQDTDFAVELIIAFAALSLLIEQDLSRLHACQNEQCALLFYDSTKSATRHWCSTACMNRARSRKNYRQAKEMSLPPTDL